jgi:hypothetical protein
MTPLAQLQAEIAELEARLEGADPAHEPRRGPVIRTSPPPRPVTPAPCTECSRRDLETKRAQQESERGVRAAMRRMESRLLEKRAAIKRMEQRLMRRRAALQALIVEHPRVSHEALEVHVWELRDLCFHGVDRPAGWKIRWGRVTRVGFLGDFVLGQCLRPERLILITEPRSLPASARSRCTPHNFNQTCLHELIHMSVDYAKEADGNHGPKFRAALKSAMDFFSAMPESRRADVVARASWLIGPKDAASATKAALR